MRPIPQSSKPPAKASLVFVAAAAPKGKGIYSYWIQTDGMEVSQNITLVPLGLAIETPNPSFLAIDPKRRLLFAATRVPEFNGKPGGAISSFTIDPSTGRLTLLSQRASMAVGPC